MSYAETKAWRQRHPDLKAYRAEEARKWRKEHPDLWREIKQRHRLANIERIRETDRMAQAEYRKTTRYKEAQRARTNRFKEKQKAERLAIAGRPQPDKCEICNGNEYRIVWDHCHTGGHFRGWICDRCNRVLGLIKDNRDILVAMERYLDNGQVNNGSTKKDA